MTIVYQAQGSSWAKVLQSLQEELEEDETDGLHGTKEHIRGD